MELNFGLVTLLMTFWITLVILSAGIHFFIIEIMKDRPIYMQWFIIRGFFAIMYAVPFHFTSLKDWIPLLVFQITSHIVIFNPLLNKLRDIKYREELLKRDIKVIPKFLFWYLGVKSGWLDKLLGKLGLTFYKFFYFASAGLMIFSMVIIYSRYA